MAKRRRGFDRRPPARSPAPAGGRGLRLAAPGLIVIAVVAVAAVAVALGGGPGATPTLSTGGVGSGTPLTAAASPTIGPEASVGIPCEPTERIDYHVHAHLNIRIDGELQLIPAGIGILPTCFSWLHTHVDSGIIHVEAPAERDFTLGEFFDVWGRPLSATQVGDRAVGPGESMFVFVDREPYSGDPRAVVLRDLEAIEIQVGPAALEPLPYTFPADFE